MDSLVMPVITKLLQYYNYYCPQDNFWRLNTDEDGKEENNIATQCCGLNQFYWLILLEMDLRSIFTQTNFYGIIYQVIKLCGFSRKHENMISLIHHCLYSLPFQSVI